MIMTILKTANTRGKYRDPNARRDVLRYILDPRKAMHYTGGYGVDMNDPARSMDEVAMMFGKTQGVQLRHFILSFYPKEMNDPVCAECIAEGVAEFFTPSFQVVYAVHEDTAHLNVHIVVNAISYRDGHRFNMGRNLFNAFQNHIKRVLRRYGLHGLWYVSAHSDEV